MYGSSYLFTSFFTHQYVIPYSKYVRFVIFPSCLLLSIISCLHSIIASHSNMNDLFNIISCQKTTWLGVACRVLWYVLHTEKDVAANKPDQGSSLSRYLFCKSNVLTRFAMNCWIISKVELSREFAVVLHLTLIPYLFLIRSLSIHDQGIHSYDHT